MTEQKKNDKGFFTQLPIILFDEYADKMPATSFVAFMRFYRHCGYKGVFKGSIRKLCSLLKMARGSIHRAIAHWVKCGLVRKGEQHKIGENRDEMVLLIQGMSLWKENIAYSQSLQGYPSLGQTASAEGSNVPENKESVPNWDNVVPETSHLVPERDDIVPVVSSKYPPYITEDSNKITLDKTEDSDAFSASSPATDSFIHSSDIDLNFQEESDAPPTSENVEQPDSDAHDSAGAQGYKTSNSEMSDATMLLDWVKELGIPRSPKTAPAHVEKLLSHGVKSKNDTAELLGIARTIHPNKMIWLGNLAEDRALGEWLQATTPDVSPAPTGMTHDQADNFAQWLMQQSGFGWETVAIDQPWNDGAWVTCILVAPDEWLPFSNPDHFLNPSPWEQEQIEQVKARGASIAQREAIAV